MQRRSGIVRCVNSCVTASLAFAAVGCTGNVNSSDPRQTDRGVEDDGGGGGGGGGGNGPPAVSACGGTPKAAPGKWRRLTATQYANTVRDLLGDANVTVSVPDSVTGPFKTNSALPVGEAGVSTYSTIAGEVASKAVTKLSALMGGCNTSASGGEDKCANQFINQFGARAFRRPLTPEEESALKAVYTVGKDESFSTGIRLVIQATLQSPSFLYLVETGLPDASGARKLTSYEMASRLSYLFTGSMPDAGLFTTAKEGKLENAAGIRTAAERLLGSPKFVGQVASFYAELMGIEKLTDTALVSKAPKFAASFDATMRKAMVDEQQKFVEYVMTKGSGTVEELLSANYVFPVGPLSKIYGASARPDGEGRALIADSTRKGLLTLAANLAVHPLQFSPSAAVNRGHVIRRDFLCETVPPPTVAVDFTPPPGAEKMTAQELLREHQRNPTCFACHRLMDSIGFALESYDAVGAYRTKDDAGNSIDPSGEVVGLASNGRFSNAAEMADLLSRSPEVRTCMSTQWFRFAVGRAPEDADACTQEQVSKAFLEGKGDVKQAILSLVTSDSFRMNGGQ